MDLADDHQVDNRRVVEALVEACRAARVAFVDDEVASVTAGPSGVAGVTLRGGGRLHAGAVVVAAGCHSGQVGGLPDSARPPVRPVKGLTLRLRAPRWPPAVPDRAGAGARAELLPGAPRPDGTVVVGATVEEKGFDLTVQAGSVVDLLDDARH